MKIKLFQIVKMKICRIIPFVTVQEVPIITCPTSQMNQLHHHPNLKNLNLAFPGTSATIAVEALAPSMTQHLHLDLPTLLDTL